MQMRSVKCTPGFAIMAGPFPDGTGTMLLRAPLLLLLLTTDAANAADSAALADQALLAAELGDALDRQQQELSQREQLLREQADTARQLLDQQQHYIEMLEQRIREMCQQGKADGMRSC